MISGQVNSQLELLADLEVEDDGGVLRPVRVILDTGFDGYLALPEATIRRLGLTLRGQVRVGLAVGDTLVNSYSAQVWWHEKPAPVEIIATDGESLLGTALLSGSKLTASFRPGGELLIEEE